MASDGYTPPAGGTPNIVVNGTAHDRAGNPERGEQQGDRRDCRHAEQRVERETHCAGRTHAQHADGHPRRQKTADGGRASR